MAKSIKKGPSVTVNPRSRAAKRATSPGIDVDKSIREAPRATDATPVLSASRNGGITKKRKKSKQMTRGQRVRQEKVLSRAEAVMDQMVKKVETARSRQARIDTRRIGWEEVNERSKKDDSKAVQATDHPASGPARQDPHKSSNDDIKMGVSGAALEAQPNTLDKGQIHTPNAQDDEVDLIT